MAMDISTERPVPGRLITALALTGWGGMAALVAAVEATATLSARVEAVAVVLFLALFVVSLIAVGAWFARILNTGLHPAWMRASDSPQIVIFGVLVAGCGALIASVTRTVGASLAMMGIVALVCGCSAIVERHDRDSTRQGIVYRWATVPSVAISSIVFVVAVR